MSQESKVIYIEPGKSPTRGAIHEVCDQVRQLVLRRLGVLLNHMLDNADDALFERAEKAISSQLQAEYFHAMRQLRLQRREVDEIFQKEMAEAFRRMMAHPAVRSSAPAPLPKTGEELTLLDNEALETSIAIDSMVAKVRLRCAQPLMQLEMRLDHLITNRQINEKNNPLDPQQICDAFVKATDVLQVELSARLILYKLFDRYVMGQAAGLYDEVNRMLIDIGVLPQLKTSALRPGAADRGQSGPAEQGASSGAQLSAPAGSMGGAAAAPDPLFTSLQQLLSMQRQNSAAEWTGTGYTQPSAPPANPVDVVAALSALQRNAVSEGAVDADLKHLLVQALMSRSGQEQTLGRNEDDTIDIVGMLFEAILDDPHLPSSIKALIARLQIPVLKVALLEPTFFGSSRHPARRLINEMSRAALGWVEPAQPERDPLYRQIDQIVERVLNEFEDNVQLFDELLQDFLIFLEEERERARLIEERTRQAAEGKAKVDGAKQRVDEEISKRLRGRRVPEVVRTLLDEAWSKVLFISLLKEGEQSETWQRQLNVVDRLLWSVDPRTGEQERQRLLAEIPGLLHDLREGLNAILFNPFEMTKLFKTLEAEHLRCLSAAERREAAPAAEGAEATPEAGPGAAAEERQPEIAERRQAGLIGSPRPEAPEEAGQATAEAAAPDQTTEEEQPDPELLGYLQTLEEIAIGTWFELAPSGGSRLRAKLSAKLSGGRRFIFVNRAGFKVADKSIEEVARDLQQGAATILDDNLLFDKALETVISNLKDMRAGR